MPLIHYHTLPFPRIEVRDLLAQDHSRAVTEQCMAILGLWRSAQPWVSAETRRMLGDGSPGTATREGFFPGNFINPAILIYRELFPEIWDRIMSDPAVSGSDLFLRLCKKFDIRNEDLGGRSLVSCYGSGGGYLPHADYAAVTVIYYPSLPVTTPYTGGDLRFTEFDISWPCEPNSMIIFPGVYTHTVAPIVADSDPRQILRISITNFMWSTPQLV